MRVSILEDLRFPDGYAIFKGGNQIDPRSDEGKRILDTFFQQELTRNENKQQPKKPKSAKSTKSVDKKPLGRPKKQIIGVDMATSEDKTVVIKGRPRKISILDELAKRQRTY